MQNWCGASARERRSFARATRCARGRANVLLIALDDTGFAQQAVMARTSTRRNRRALGMRFRSNADTGFSNCGGQIPPKAETIAEVPRDHGCNTFALGMWHLANRKDSGPAGPFDQWRLRCGIDH